MFRPAERPFRLRGLVGTVALVSLGLASVGLFGTGLYTGDPAWLILGGFSAGVARALFRRALSIDVIQTPQGAYSEWIPPWRDGPRQGPQRDCTFALHPTDHSMPAFGDTPIWVVDTGAHGTVVSRSTLLAMGLDAANLRRSSPRCSLTGFGQGYPPVAQGLSAEPGHAGPLVFQRLSLWVLPRLLPGVDALLGLNQLHQGWVVIDLQSWTFHFVTDEDSVRILEPWMDATSPMRIDGPGLIVLGELEGTSVRIHLDTGASFSSASLQMKLPHPSTHHVVQQNSGWGIQGRTASREVVKLAGLEVGGQTLELLVGSDPVERDWDINLGMDALHGRVLVFNLKLNRAWLSGAGPSAHRCPTLRGLIEHQQSEEPKNITSREDRRPQ